MNGDERTRYGHRKRQPPDLPLLIRDCERNEYNGETRMHATVSEVRWLVEEVRLLTEENQRLATVRGEGLERLTFVVTDGGPMFFDVPPEVNREIDRLRSDQRDWRKGVDLIATALGVTGPGRLSCAALAERALELQAELEELRQAMQLQAHETLYGHEDRERAERLEQEREDGDICPDQHRSPYDPR